jgi:hypothetical protein
MSSLIHYYLLLFISFLLNKTLIHSLRQHSCITIGNSSISSDNMCLDEVDDNQTIIIHLTCRIKETFKMKTDGCPQNYSHIILTFSNNSIFETFFDENHDIMQHLFEERTTTNVVALHIVIESHNLTKITWNYIHSTLKTDPNMYSELFLAFRQTNKNAPQPEIGDDFSYYENSLIKVQISCRDGYGENMYYAIENGSMALEENNCKPFFIRYLSGGTENFNTAGKNESHHIITTTVTSELASPIAADTATKTGVEHEISMLRTTELTHIAEEKTTKEYQIMKLITTKLADNVSRSVSNAAGITISTKMKLTTAQITSRPVNITFSFTKPSKKSHTVLLLYLLPSLLIILTCIIIITVCVILTHRRQHKLRGIVDEDSSVMSNIASTDTYITKNNDSTSAITSQNNSTTYLSPLAKPTHKTIPIDQPKKHVTHTFDNNF